MTTIPDLTTAPDRSEAAEYYFTYIEQVPEGDVLRTLEAQLDETIAFMESISDAQSHHRYAPDKWSIREVLAHINDTERVFAFRAFWFARALLLPLPSFDQDVAVPTSAAEDRTWASHIDEFRAVRGATLALFRGLTPEGWTRRGIASEKEFSVRALAFITAGHVTHHVRLLRERYL